MVRGEVIVKKPFNYKGLFLWIFGIVLLLGVVYFIFFLGSMFGPYRGQIVEYENPIVSLIEGLKSEGIIIQEGENIDEAVQEQIIEKAESDFDYKYINYVLYALSAYKLHRIPLTNNYPRIRVLVDNEEYGSGVKSGEITTVIEGVENPDIVIKLTKREVIEAMLAREMAEFMKESVYEGRTEIEMLANKVVLAGKGYLQMYKDITGENLELEGSEE